MCLVVSQYLPLLYMHMCREDITSEMYLMDWNLSLFSKVEGCWSSPHHTHHTATPLNGRLILAHCIRTHATGPAPGGGRARVGLLSVRGRGLHPAIGPRHSAHVWLQVRAARFLHSNDALWDTTDSSFAMSCQAVRFVNGGHLAVPDASARGHRRRRAAREYRTGDVA